jgi:hypothetical protein
VAVATDGTQAGQPTKSAKGRKLRAFVVERASGRPASGVTVVAKAQYGGITATIGVLSSDSAGYVSFDISQWVDGEKVWLELAGQQEPAAVVVTPTGGDGAQPVVLQVEAAKHVRLERRNRRPSVENPDVRDWEISPTSFVTQPAIELGEDGCRVPVPVSGPTQTVRYFQIVQSRRPTPKEGPHLGREAAIDMSGAAGSLSIEPLAQVDSAPVPKLCEIIEFRQDWYDLGHSLGSVLYSLPLAPCESVKLAVVEASRSDAVGRQDALLSQESLLHDLRRDRALAETVATTVNESQQGWSVGGGIGIPFGRGVATIGGAVSRSWGSRDLTGQSQQDLHDTTVQATGVVRSLNSTVVVQATQTEEHHLQTRTVTNHNHCHALTVQYYEVLRRLKLETTYVGSRPGILIPYPVLSFTKPFPDATGSAPVTGDLRTVNRLRPLLEASLLRPELRPNFEAVRRLLFFTTAKAPPSPPPKPSAPTDFDVTGITFRLKRGRWGTGGGPPSALNVKIKVRLRNGAFVQFESPPQAPPHSDAYFVQDPGLDGNEAVDDLAPTWLEDHYASFSVPVKRSDLDEIQVHWTPHSVGWGAIASWSFRGLDVRAMTSSGLVELLRQEATDNRNPGVDFQDFTSHAGMRAFPVPRIAPAPAPTDPQPSVEPTKAQDEALAWELIGHLDEQRISYSRYIVERTDPTWFASALDKVMPAAIRSRIDPFPVAISGPHVVFATDEKLPARPGPAPNTDIVSLPTRGMLAEAQLGTCNACEKRDVTRFWKWEESPCPEEAPAISGVAPGFRGQMPTVQSASLPSPVVQIAQPSAAPDPAGLAAALNLLGQPNLFRDMSGQKELGQLLGGLSAGTLDLEKARVLATAAVKKAASAGSAAGTAPPAKPEETYDRLKVIDAAREAGLITDRDATKAAGELLSGGGPGVMGTAAGAILEAILGQAGPQGAGQQAAQVFPGFDRRDYPGDAAMRTWWESSPYYWVGYYLTSPCRPQSTWMGKRAFLTGLGWGLAVLFVGQQDPANIDPNTGKPRCPRNTLTAAQGATDGNAAIATTKAEGFPSGTTILLDMEASPGANHPQPFIDYFKAWLTAIETEGTFAPGVYCHRKNAAQVRAASDAAYEAMGMSGLPRFWVVGGKHADFQLDGPNGPSPPSASGIPYAELWQDPTLDITETHGGVQIGPIDRDVSIREDPSSPGLD